LLSLVHVTPCTSSATPFPYTTLFRSRWCSLAFIGTAVRPACHTAYRTSTHSGLLLMASATRSPGCRPQRCVSVPASWATRLTRRSEEHTSELQSRVDLVCRLLLEQKN